MSDNRQARVNRLAQQWNEEDIPPASINHWLAQFDREEQSIAMRLLECMEMHSWARLLRECRVLHQPCLPESQLRSGDWFQQHRTTAGDSSQTG